MKAAPPSRANRPQSGLREPTKRSAYMEKYNTQRKPTEEKKDEKKVEPAKPMRVQTAKEAPARTLTNNNVTPKTTFIQKKNEESGAKVKPESAVSSSVRPSTANSKNASMMGTQRVGSKQGPTKATEKFTPKPEVSKLKSPRNESTRASFVGMPKKNGPTSKGTQSSASLAKKLASPE